MRGERGRKIHNKSVWCPSAPYPTRYPPTLPPIPTISISHSVLSQKKKGIMFLIIFSQLNCSTYFSGIRVNRSGIICANQNEYLNVNSHMPSLYYRESAY